MKLSKIIYSLVLIAVSLAAGKAIAIDSSVKVSGFTSEEIHFTSIVNGKKESLNRIVSAEDFFLNTSTQSVGTSRTDVRNLLDALFISFFSFKRIRSTCGNCTNEFQLQVALHALKIIYPHHHFW